MLEFSYDAGRNRYKFVLQAMLNMNLEYISL